MRSPRPCLRRDGESSIQQPTGVTRNEGETRDASHINEKTKKYISDRIEKMEREEIFVKKLIR